MKRTGERNVPGDPGNCNDAGAQRGEVGAPPGWVGPLVAGARGSGSRSRAVDQVRALWIPLGLILLGYGVAQLVNGTIADRIAQGTPNALGFGLHLTEPAAVDRFLFGGELPTAWLQERLYGPRGPQWYDAVGALVYISHFVVIPAVAAVLWFRDRTRFRDWIGCVLLMTGVGIVIYVVYPMSPPWLAAEVGVIEPVARIPGLGWQYLHLAVVGDLLGTGQAASNPVAAMPSLHAAGAAVLAVFCWSRTGWCGRGLLALYPVLMGLTLVYTGEHYVIDVLVGWLVALFAGVVGPVVLGRRRKVDEPKGVARDTQSSPVRAAKLFGVR